ncbi:nucleotidyltransferase-like protein [Kribbella rubisoli]|uniref:Nucleotidyltransferase-like protein n=1 Tax=Kribbella rubisoli TaxID=3075929 RepID=A0A4Q7WST2_9ACTN|nr:nucleotidyltransferase domain-containing protein [Kribbella rubisoli]RZU13467.1 nucleotidyltransferase-like protein [Kribbella rubisoli]
MSRGDDRARGAAWARGPAAPRLAHIRDRWLSAATTALQDDPGVDGAALVGSLGAGRADDWSDVDLLLVVKDEHLDDYAVPHRLPSGPGRRAFEIDARHNGPIGTRAVSAQYVVDGLPLWVDWYVHPVSLATWPPDSAVIFDRHGITGSLSEHRGDHEPATPKTPDEHEAMRLALIPIAAKQLARDSPDAPRTIEFLGGSAGWPDHLAALRQLLTQFDPMAHRESLAAAHAYLDLLETLL